MVAVAWEELVDCTLRHRASVGAATLPRVQPTVVNGVLSVLPFGIIDLELCIPCADPLPAALLRFRRLRQLSLWTGGLDWQGVGGPFVLGRLVQLTLDYRWPPEWNGEYFGSAEVGSLESSITADLSHATHLVQLGLRIRGAQNLQSLCGSLPALRELRWACNSADAHCLHCWGQQEQANIVAQQCTAVWTFIGASQSQPSKLWLPCCSCRIWCSPWASTPTLAQRQQQCHLNTLMLSSMT